MGHIHKRLGKVIRYWRINRRLTQKQLAYYAKLNPAYIGHIERGEKNIGLTNLVKIARGLNVRVSELVAGVEKPDLRYHFTGYRKRVRPK